MAATSDIIEIATADSTSGEVYDDIGGGQGSGFNSDLPIEGDATRARRIDNTSTGYSYDNGVGINLGASGGHVGFWTNVLQWKVITTFITYYLGGGGSPTTTPYNTYNYDPADYPETGGYIRVFIDLARTRDGGAGTLNASSVRQFGTEYDMGNVGGNAQNCHQDSVDFLALGHLLTGGTSGSPETLDTVAAYDSANAIGIFDGANINGAVRLGGANTHIEQSNVVVRAGAQPLAAADWIRFDFILDQATCVARLLSGSLNGVHITSTGVAGEGSLGSISLLNAPLPISLTSAMRWFGSLVTSPTLTALGADLRDFSIEDSQAAINESALIWDETSDPLGKLDNITFTRGAIANHALELGTNSPLNITLKGQKYNEYNAANNQNDSAIHIKRTSGTVTLNITDGGDTPSYRSDGATVVIVDSRSLSISGFPASTVLVVYDKDNPDPQNLGTELLRDDTATGTVVYTYDALKSGDEIVITAYKDGFKAFQEDYTLTSTDAPFNVSMIAETN